MNYTEEQENIFEFVKNGTGHGIIDAVAGAGKTTTIIKSAAFVPTENKVLFCAFNKSISTEIESKFNQRGMQRVNVHTIHALGLRILKAYNNVTEIINVQENKYQKIVISVAVQRQMRSHYHQIMLINNLDPNEMDNSFVKNAINSLTYRINNRLIEMVQKFRATLCLNKFEKFKRLVEHFGIFNSIEINKKDFEKELKEHYSCVQILLEEGNYMARSSMIIDFTDMLYLPHEWRLKTTQKFDFIFIDECQDLSKSQFAICAKYGKSTARIMAVGDPHQSIYGFTGADIESFNNIKTRTKALQLPLTTCFRCPQGMIELAKEFRPDIIGNKKEDGIIDEVFYNSIIGLAEPNDLVISRFKAPLAALVFEFINKELKVQIHEDDAKDFINALRYLFKPIELNAEIRNYGGFEHLKRQVYDREAFKIQKQSERIVNPIDRDIFIKDEIYYLELRLNFIEKRSLKWELNCNSVEAILIKIKEYITAEQNAVKLSTIHRAKGLEEDRVFILDYERMPHKRMDIQGWEQTQEINLKYVAVTRAKKALFLVKPEDLDEIEDNESLFDNLF